MWDPSISVLIYQASAHAVTCGIFIQAENVNLTVTFVYGFNQVEDRHSLWDELHLLNVSTPLSRHPWAVAGDFNQILRSTHHSNRQWINVDTSGIDDFNLALQDAELFEAQAKGLPLTWWNNQDDNPISKKIDHALINQKWSDLFPDAYADFLEPQQSDHAVCLFRVPSLQRHVCKPFKFFHHVIDHLEYEDSVKEAWNCEVINGSFQFKLARSLKLMKKVLRRINKRYYSGISERVTAQAKKVLELQRILLTNPDSASIKHEQNGKPFKKQRKSIIVTSQNLILDKAQ